VQHFAFRYLSSHPTMPTNDLIPQALTDLRHSESGVHDIGVAQQPQQQSEEQQQEQPQQQQEPKIYFDYYQDHLDELLEPLPDWIQNYLHWHAEQRRKFPGMQLFTHPDAPNLLVRVCLGLCGGLHDRLGQLPWDLYLANQTQRVLLLAWQRPRALEHFLQPAFPQLFNWSIPPEADYGFDGLVHVRDHVKELFDYPAMPEANPTQAFWQHDVDTAIARANAGDDKVLRHRILGHLGEYQLEQRLQQLHGETNTKLHEYPIFGNLFWLFFRPNPAIATQFKAVLHDELQLSPQNYTVVHCRVRHPKAVKGHVLGKNPNYPADKTGLPWVGEARTFAIETATHAVACALYILQAQPIYFMSDSNDLVRHVAFELQDAAQNDSDVDRPLLQMLAAQRIRARDPTMENPHIDRQKGRPPAEYYPVFVDLLLAIHARCVVYGIGYYAKFAAKLSGTTCKLRYAEEVWGKNTDGRHKKKDARHKKKDAETEKDDGEATCTRPMYQKYLA